MSSNDTTKPKNVDYFQVPDELWKMVRRFLPAPAQQRRPGRPRADDRAALNGIWYVLWTGCQWKAIHRNWFGVSSSVIHQRFQTWRKKSVFADVMREMVLYYQTTREIGWQWQSIDSKSCPAPLGGEETYIGMVFQKPNPFPKSIYENVAWGARINGYRGDLDALVEQSLRKAALWDEVKDKLQQSGLSLSGGQQQRLCIARTIAVKPDIILMDEPASALDPIATLRIEELMRELAKNYTIIVVTHNMQQAGRVSDYTAFFNMGEDRAGYLVEYGPTKQVFTNPQDQRTEDYITGWFG